MIILGGGLGPHLLFKVLRAPAPSQWRHLGGTRGKIEVGPGGPGKNFHGGSAVEAIGGTRRVAALFIRGPFAGTLVPSIF